MRVNERSWHGEVLCFVVVADSNDFSVHELLWTYAQYSAIRWQVYSILISHSYY